MRKLLLLSTLVLPVFAMTSAESFEETTTTSEESGLSAKVQIAYELKRDAESYLAGQEMTRALQLRLKSLQAAHPNVDDDELVELALDEADTVIEGAKDVVQ